MKKYVLVFWVFCCHLNIMFGENLPKLQLCVGKKGLQELIGNNRNYIDKGEYLGNWKIAYTINGSSYKVSLNELVPKLLISNSQRMQMNWSLPGSVCFKQEFQIKEDKLDWNVEFMNTGHDSLMITDMAFLLPIGAVDKDISARHNLNKHFSVNLNSSFFYWIPYDGQGDILLMTMQEGTSLEYNTVNGEYYLHSMNAVDRVNDTWRIPSTQKIVHGGDIYRNGFSFMFVPDTDKLVDRLYEVGCLVSRIVPGMVVTPEMDVHCVLQSRLPIHEIIPEHINDTRVVSISQNNDDKYIYKIRFSQLGENNIRINYGEGKAAYLDFFVTEPLETLIKKRSEFITKYQQIRDTTKWYNGLYGLWDMQKSELLSPEYLGDLKWEYLVGGSDDPSNSKPILVSEKNVVYPQKEEIESLEYYEKHFVWGKLQRTDEEYPYPFGIYGSDNWYQNRSGNYGDYNSGGSGKERMWRTFDYTTHFAIYYNLYRIAENNPDMVTYLNADGYLERAYQTAMAYFEVPYNIKMGNQWAFHGWCDWAFKQGNFHERYLLYIIEALRDNHREKEAQRLEREWKKKVLYMIYEDPWPFGSEMFVDRTAYESSYYIAEYAKLNSIEAEEQLWYDKNKQKWYTYRSLDKSDIDRFMQLQLDGNLALRGIIEPGYASLGTAWAGQSCTLDYMTQMGGVALLDYAYKFSDNPAKYINYGYNSLMASWALMNTGTAKSNYGYWYQGKDNDGAVAWGFSPYQHSSMWVTGDIGRTAWRYDGEIDHGLTGGIHGAGVYVVQDPDLGFVCYGGNMNIRKKDFIILPYDGVRRLLRICSSAGRFSIELKQDGFRRDFPIVWREGEKIKFGIENRRVINHETTIVIEGLPTGCYEFKIDGKLFKTFNIDNLKVHPYKIDIPISGDEVLCEIIRK